VNFQVLPPRTSPDYASEEEFALIQHTWNDYSFETQYSLVYLGPKGNRAHNLIGTVKILKKGQTSNDGLQLTENFDYLGENFISVGQSLDYYERISALHDNLRIQLLESLNDYVYHPELAKEFRLEDGWKTSLFRYFNENDNFLLTAKSLLHKNFEELQASDLNFSFQATGWDREVNFDYSLPIYAERVGGIAHPIPSRIISVIGRNGSGKSTLLARIARVAYGSIKDRQDGAFSSAGSIFPSDISFPRIITVSYSAFDSFRLPGLKPTVEGEADERRQVVKDIKDGVGRFVFCGLRDVAAELDSLIKEEYQLEKIAVSSDKVHTTLLKPIEQLAGEFHRTLLLVKSKNATHILDRALYRISGDPSFSIYQQPFTTNSLLENNPLEQFLTWSTGHKIVMHIIANLAAHTTQSSLILIDEPETHLHPPLLAALMHAVRMILATKKAFAIIATHSPVVLQESIVKHTLIVKREGQVTTTTRPSKETFGENIGILTGEVFGLNTRETDFHAVLDQLIAQHKNLDIIEYFFQPHGLSMQARAYVISELARRGLL